MILAADRKALATALKAVTRALPRTTGHPVLNGVKVDANNDGTVRLTCSDLDLTITTTLEADVTEPGQAVIPASRLTNIVDKLGAETVNIADGDESAAIVIGAGKTVAELHPLRVEEWPQLTDGGEVVATLGERQLNELARILPMASTDMGRANLIGVAFDGDTIWACDSYRGAIANWGVTLPEPAYLQATSLKPIVAADAPLDMSVSANHVTFVSATTTWTLRQIAEEPAQLARLFRPASTPTKTFTVATNALGEVLDRLRALDASESVRIAVVDGEALLTCVSADVGTITDSIEVNSDVDFRFAVAPAYLGAALVAAQADEITFHLVDGTKPMEVLDGDFRQLVMPIRVPGWTGAA